MKKMHNIMKKLKRNIAVGIALTVLAGYALTGCSSSKGVITLKDDIVKVHVGEALSTELSDYVRASKSMMEDMTLDLSRVNVDRIGSYVAYVFYENYSTKFTIEVTDLHAPTISLIADTFYLELSGTLKLEDVVASVEDDTSYEYGFSDDMTLADDKKGLLDEIKFTSQGEYACEIIARDGYRNYSVKEFTVKVVNSGEVPSGAVQVEDYSAYMNQNTGVDLTDLNRYSDESVDYGVGGTKDEETNRPNLSYYSEQYAEYTVDFIQPESRYIWLTFNEQYERGYTEQILDTLKEKQVSAVFFVTKTYMESNPELIRRMLEEGHVLGNDTATGTTISGLSVNELTTQIDVLYNYAYENYGYEMYLFRSPAGNFSEKSLAVAQKLGYRTVFWSYAYADWNADAQPDVKESLERAVNALHGGEIIAFSGGSSTNAAMLGDLIDEARAKGYEFAIYQKN